jgi:tight adherence protein B
VSGALLCLAVAALCWPRRAVLSRLRPAPGRGRPDVPLAAAAVVVAGAAGALLSTPVVAALAAAGAGAGVRAWRGRVRARDAREQVQALAEALGVLAAELRAGRSLPDATGTAVSSCPHPGAAAALGPALGPGSVAADLPEEARDALGRVVTAARVSARTGCSLAAVVTAAEDDLRAGLRTRAELGAALSGPRASAAVLAGLPVLGLLMGSGIGADPWRVLTTTPVGTVLLVVGVGLEAAGIAWSGRLAARAARA